MGAWFHVIPLTTFKEWRKRCAKGGKEEVLKKAEKGTVSLWGGNMGLTLLVGRMSKGEGRPKLLSDTLVEEPSER